MSQTFAQLLDHDPDPDPDPQLSGWTGRKVPDLSFQQQRPEEVEAGPVR